MTTTEQPRSSFRGDVHGKFVRGATLLAKLVESTFPSDEDGKAQQGVSDFMSQRADEELEAMAWAAKVFEDALPLLQQSIHLETVSRMVGGDEFHPVLEYGPILPRHLAEVAVLLAEGECEAEGVSVSQVDPQYGAGKLERGFCVWTKARERVEVIRPNENSALIAVSKEADPAARVWPGHGAAPK